MNQINRNCKIHILLQRIVNPFSPYFICQHFIGNEFRKYGISHILPGHLHDVLETGDLTRFNEYDILYVEVRFFERFVVDYLPKIQTKIVLMTGGCQAPQVYKSLHTDTVLNHPNIALWISQNPIYSSHPKYMAFPYGIYHKNLKAYASALKNTRVFDKPIVISNLPMNRTTHPCRKMLPEVPSISNHAFYDSIANSKFVLSPIGDREDCYRHYECIGLGAIPISNVSSNYAPIFGDSMYYCDIEKMIEILNTGQIDYTYRLPNRDILSLEYHTRIIFDRIQYIRVSSVVPNEPASGL